MIQLNSRGVIEVNPDGVAPGLKERDQWVLWRMFKRGNQKPTKVPLRTDAGPAKSNDFTTWTTFDAAWEAYLRGGYDGIGYVFSEDDPFCGIDLDGCRDPATGKIAPWAQEIIDKLDSYAEVSPSGSGVKIFIRGKSPFKTGKNQNLPQFGSMGGKNAGIEIYDHGRYFCVTGERIKEVVVT